MPFRSRLTLALLATVLASGLAGVTAASAAPSKPGYGYFVVGNGNDVIRTTTGGLLLMGGGTDVDDGFRWLDARSGGGDVVVIRATGTDAYNPYIAGLGSVDSVETLVIPSRAAASDPFVVGKISKAEALFIAGGDQWDYVNFWKGTPVEDAIHALAARNVPIGGTSAGLAILGGFSFTAQNGTVDSKSALGDPYGNRIALERDFLHLPGMDGIITDSHFVTRDRMGRLITFLARIVKDGWAAQAKGIGIDEQTALAVEPNGSVSVLGGGAAYFLRTPGAPEQCLAKKSLTYRNLGVYRVRAGATFNLVTWSGSGGTAFTVSAQSGAVTSTQAGGATY